MNDRYIVARAQGPGRPAVEPGRGRGREDGVALELDQREVGLRALDHGSSSNPDEVLGRQRR